MRVIYVMYGAMFLVLLLVILVAQNCESFPGGCG